MRNKIYLGNVFAMVICLAGMTTFSGCDREEINREFYLYSNVEDFYKTAPVINKYLNTLPINMSVEQQLKDLTDWLNLQPCIINATLKGVWTDKDCITFCQPGRYGNIAIMLDDNGLTRELTLNIFGEYSKSLHATDYSFAKPKEVRAFYKSDSTTLSDVFDFINL